MEDIRSVGDGAINIFLSFNYIERIIEKANSRVAIDNIFSELIHDKLRFQLKVKPFGYQII